MAEAEKVATVLHKADKLVKELDKTVTELIQMLRDYQNNQEETPNA